jgi:MFS transporter, PAT family, beta-lactamase induction signal transducer AmpG
VQISIKKIRKAISSNYVWTFTTYFTEGFPFTATRTVVPLFLRDMKVPLENIGLTSLYGLPWILKFLWSPQVDESATKRSWLLWMQFSIIVMMFIAAILAPLSVGVQAIAILFFIVAVISATHDVAIDGYYMAALDKNDQAKYVGFRVMAYRIAMMTATGVVVTVGTAVSWPLAFASAGAIMSIFFIYHFFFLREVEEYKKSYKELFSGLLKLKKIFGVTILALIVVGLRYFLKSQYYASFQDSVPFLKSISFAHWVGIMLLLALVLVALLRNKIKQRLTRDPDSNYSKAFLAFVDRENIGIILSFIIFLRIGDWMLSSMVSPFFVDVGIKVHYGWLTSLVGLPASIVGGMVGGWAIYKYGLRKVIWPFILAQNFTLLFYMFLAFHLSDYIKVNTGVDAPFAIGSANLLLVGATMCFEQLAAGLGTAVLMTYMMRLCIPEFKATHYAIASGLMGLSGMFTGVASGFLAGWLGYGWTFGISFAVSIPAMMLIPFLPFLDIQKK